MTDLTEARELLPDGLAPEEEDHLLIVTNGHSIDSMGYFNLATALHRREAAMASRNAEKRKLFMNLAWEYWCEGGGPFVLSGERKWGRIGGSKSLENGGK